LLKHLLKDDNFELLDIIFNNNIKLFDNEIIIKFLLCYKYKKPLSKSELNQLINNYNLSTKKDKYILIIVITQAMFI